MPLGLFVNWDSQFRRENERVNVPLLDIKLAAFAPLLSLILDKIGSNFLKHLDHYSYFSIPE